MSATDKECYPKISIYSTVLTSAGLNRPLDIIRDGKIHHDTTSLAKAPGLRSASKSLNFD